MDHLNKRVNEYTGYQGDSTNKLADLKSQQDAAKAAIAALDAANQTLKDAKFALDSSPAWHRTAKAIRSSRMLSP